MILGVDPGSRRVGVSVADPETRFARPLEVIDTRVTDPVARIEALTLTTGATVVVVGRPLGLSGTEGPAARSARDFAAALARRLPVPVVEHDERFTTVTAQKGLISAGTRGRARKRLIDAVAAQIMLQSWLDAGGGLE